MIYLGRRLAWRQRVNPCTLMTLGCIKCGVEGFGKQPCHSCMTTWPQDEVCSRGVICLNCMQTIVDMSCGSGLFSRRFVRSGKFESVIAADFSESMLGQARLFFEEDKSIDPR